MGDNTEYIWKKDFWGKWTLVPKPDNSIGMLLLFLLVIIILCLALITLPLWVALSGFAMNKSKRYYAGIGSVLALLYFLIDVKNKWITGFLFLGSTDETGKITEGIIGAKEIIYVYFANGVGVIIGLYFIYQSYLINKESNILIKEKPFEAIRSRKDEYDKTNIITGSENPNRTLYLVFGVLILVIIGGIIGYGVTNNGSSTEEQASIQKAKQDSIARVSQAKTDTLAKVIEASSDIANENTASSAGQANSINEEIKTKIYKYYEALQADGVDANNYFASNVSQFYTKKNVSPNDINSINASGKSEFSNPEVTDINNIVLNRTENDINYYTFEMHFKCYRTSKQKTEECDEIIEIGVNQSNEFVSLKELKIENLKFYSEGDNRSSDLQSIPKTEILSIAEQMPSFPGGETERNKFIQQNISYPQVEKEAGISGTVYLTFVVDTYGNLNNIEVLRGVSGGKGCDNEAIRVVKLMPKWIAGKQNGTLVNVQFNLPIKFSLR